MAQPAQVQTPAEIQELAKALDELGFKYLFDPASQKIIIKGKTTDVGYTGHHFSIWVRQGRLKRLLIKYYPSVVEIDIEDVAFGRHRSVKLPPKVMVFFFEKYLLIEYGP